MNNEEKTYQYMTAIEKQMDSMLQQDQETYSSVVEAMRYSLLGGGKRVRGILTLAACEQVSGSFEQALSAACAIEMIHCYSLIHDDLPAMDDDNLRRGKASCHVQFGEATAILAGDALLTYAFYALTQIKNKDHAVECVAVLAEAAGHYGMVLGQEMDIAAEGKKLTAAQLVRMHEKKTGALIKASAKMGAIIGGADKRTMGALENYADNIGLAFQIVDDILDAMSDEKTLGKSTSDADNNKPTGTSTYGVYQAKNIAKELTAKAIAAINAEFYNTEYLTAFAKLLMARTK
jgi:Geranylgeranyl pyrophosphate synthase